MSASDKKKLRKEQAAAMITEQQNKERAEAKKLKIYTITFISVLLLIVCTAIAVLTIRGINNSGVMQKNTIAATVGEITTRYRQSLGRGPDRAAARLIFVGTDAGGAIY